MHSKFTYCLVVTRSDKIHTPALGQPPSGVTIISWGAEHVRGFYYNYRDGKGLL